MPQSISRAALLGVFLLAAHPMGSGATMTLKSVAESFSGAALHCFNALPKSVVLCVGVLGAIGCFNNAPVPISKKHALVKNRPRKEEDDELGCQSYVLKNPQGVATLVRRWKAINKSTIYPSKTIIIVHGFSWHSGYFAALAKRFQSSGVNVIAYDLQGHGRSGTVNGLKAYANRFDDWVLELKTVVDFELAQDSDSNKKVFLMGESMGGSIVLRAMTSGGHFRCPVAGVLLSAPVTKLAQAMLPPPPVIAVIKIMSILFPTASVPSTEVKDTFEQAFGDSLQGKSARVDPLVVFDNPRLRTATEIINTVSANRKRFHRITVPVIVLHGKKDIRTEWENSVEFVSRIQSKDKILHLFDTGFHQLLQDQPAVTSRATELLVDWVKKH